MPIKLESYEDFLTEAAPEIRGVLESTFQEASRVMSSTGLLESADSRAILQKERRGILFIKTQWKLNFYLRALWSRDFFLRPTGADFADFLPFADDYVKRIFGANNYTIIDHGDKLPEQLPTLFASLTA